MPNDASDNKTNKADGSVPQGSGPTNTAEVQSNDAIKNAAQSHEPKRPPEQASETPRPSIIRRWWDALWNKDGSNRIIAIATVVIAFSTIVSTYEIVTSSGQTDKIVTAAQSIESDLKTANQQNLQAVSRTLEQSQRNAEASNSQSKASLDATLATAHLEQRPWVAPISLHMDTIKADEPANGYVLWLNTGKTFAKKFKPSCFSTIVTPHAAKNIDMLNSLTSGTVIEQQSIGVLTPGAQYRTDLKGTQPIPATERNKMQSQPGSWYTYIWGKATYTDIFGKIHETDFCGFRQGVSGDFMECTFYNDAN